MEQQFIHLNVHSEYAIVDSIVQIKPLISKAKQQGMPALALTDVCNLFGMIKFYKAAIHQGIQPIIGAELWVKSNTPQNYHKLQLLCQNRQGYLNLVKLISQAYQEGERTTVPLVQPHWLTQHADGLIALSGIQGEVGQWLLNDNANAAKNALAQWMSIYPNRFYIELSRTQKNSQTLFERGILNLLHEVKCPIVATNEVVFLNQEDFDAHEAKVCIQEGRTLEVGRESRYTKEQYLKSSDQMAALFQDLPAALKNSVEIAKRCALSFSLDKSYLPSFPVPAGQTVESYLEMAAQQGLAKRLQIKFDINPVEPSLRHEQEQLYQERLERELITINKMGFPGYFLIVADFIQWAKQNNIPVGPGRGSGAGSLVAYSLEITDLDPIEYDLLFERFLNPERISMPDFDIDFCMDNRDRVIEYVMQRYGRSNVSQIATFGTMAAKAVIRDVGRVLGHPYGFVDKIAKLIPFEIGITIDKALEQEQVLAQRYKDEEEVKTLINLAKKLEGIARNVGKHAGGVVIAPSALTDFAPLYSEELGSNHVVIQLDKDDVETIGLTKFDFLGLRTLTIIDKALQIVNRQLRAQNQPEINIATIPLNCPLTFKLLKDCATTAVFQLESRGMKELIKRLQPDNIEEIIALVALFRPGPLQSGMVDDFINRKHGRQKLEYLHPKLESVLKPTYGVILYQEQVMQIAQTLSGYTLGGADLLRRAMGKKKPEEMAKQRHNFVEGAIARDVDGDMANYIFDIIEKFAGYGFNKSHSAAYALVSYQTAWLKAHYPNAFMAAVLSADMNHTDKIVNMIEECKNLKLTVLPPHIHTSQFEFSLNPAGEIVYGLGAIKGLGESAINMIIAERTKSPFTDFFDFCERVDSKINKKVYECLIKSGTLDPFGLERSHMMALLPAILQCAEKRSQNLSRGQQDLFGASFSPSILPQVEVKPWPSKLRLMAEKEALGMYFSGHPLHDCAAELKRMGIVYFNEVQQVKKETKGLLAGIIISVKTILTKSGDRMAIVMLDDSISRFEVTLFSEIYQNNRELLVKDNVVIAETAISLDSTTHQLKLRVQKLYTLSSYQSLHAKRLKLKLAHTDATPALFDKIKDCLILNDRGDCPIFLEYKHQEALVKVRFDDKWNIKINEDTVGRLKESVEALEVEVEY